MAATAATARLDDMSGGQRADAISERMKAVGMGVSDLAEYADVSRGLVYRVLNGEEGVRDSSFARLESALDRFEREAGADKGAPDVALSTEEGLVEFEVTGDFGVRVVVKGPVKDAVELERSVARLIRDMRQGENRPTSG